ncbi:SgcJ/EcaC family oxidoreductase [Palleronia abyssalis]|uniref:DUF4440 domain-containing protein n=1 Tax=Palleronia abyssalis TaxID=1501240 RepID=A0A2R8BW57_9RHOB|nr:SgcJ/EcaC family oxidoreductase [Palleronia abyssalis]SPJ24375.1 hypothetical protein PAA8504_02203 [Palleronia abyssalis]
MLDRPEDMPHAFRDAWMARDAAALAALFAQDADFVNVAGIWWRDRAAIEEAHEYGLRVIFPDSDLKIGRVALRMLGETAVVHARLTLTGQTGAAGVRRTVMTFVMDRTPRGWHCVAAQNTDVHPGAETMIAQDGGLAPADYRPSQDGA